MWGDESKGCESEKSWVTAWVVHVSTTEASRDTILREGRRKSIGLTRLTEERWGSRVTAVSTEFAIPDPDPIAGLAVTQVLKACTQSRGRDVMGKINVYCRGAMYTAQGKKKGVLEIRRMILIMRWGT